MNAIDVIKKLETYPLFTVNDVSRLLNTTDNYVRTYLYRLENRGLINRIERGKYTVHEDPIIFSTHLVYPSYISMWSLFSLRGLTEQVLREIMIVTSVNKMEITKGSYSISFTKSSHCFGYDKEMYQGYEVFLATVEKAIIDSLMYRKVPFDEIVKVIRSADLNPDKMTEYISRINSSSLAKRIGFLMEKEGVDMDSLLDLIDYNYILLNVDGEDTGVKNERWRLIVNDY